MKGKRKVLLVAAVALSVLFVAFTVFQNPIKILFTLSSVKKADNSPLYKMYFYGDYGFDAFLETGIPNSEMEMKSNHAAAWACSCIAALGDKDNMLFGRNFDWSKDPVLLLYTNPPDAYASVSMVDISYLGYTTDSNLDKLSARQALLYAPNIPFDGMNEYGLTVGVMAVPFTAPPYDPDKVTINELSVVRLFLDYAKTTEDAVNLLENYNVFFRQPIHYMVSDRTGKSIIIEFVDKGVKVIPNDTNWQVCTNFLLSAQDKDGFGQDRYHTAQETMKKCRGKMTQQGMMKLLNSVSQSNTIWSVVYDMNHGEIAIAMDKKYTAIKTFRFKSKNP